MANYSLGEAVLALKVDASEFDKGLKDGQKKAANTESGFAKHAKGIAQAGAAAAIAFGAASIKAASDAEEAYSKFRAVFKAETDRVEAQLESLANTTNRSKFDFIEYAGTIQDTLVPLGFARDAAADMSVSVVELANDLGSFNNIPTAQVVKDIQSALVGNTETLRKYGVVAQETQIKQEAITAGLWDGTGAIDANAKAQAIYNLILKGTTDAQGDAARTAESFANQARGMEAALQELQVTIGELLIGPASEFVKWMKDGLKVARDLVNWNKNLTATLKEHAGNVESTAENYEAYTAEMNRAAKAAGFQIDAQGDLHSITLVNGIAVKELAEANFLLSEAQFRAGRIADQVGGATARHAGRVEALARASREAADATEELGVDLAGLLDAGLSGTIGAAADDYRSSLADIQGQIADTTAEIAEMEKGGKKNADAIADARVKLDELREAELAVIEPLQAATREFIFQHVAANLDAETSLLVARNLGLIDEASYATAQAAMDLRKQYDEGKITAGEFAEKSRELADAVASLQSKEIVITQTTLKREIDAGQAWTPVGAENTTPADMMQHGGQFGAGDLVQLHPPELVLFRRPGSVISQAETTRLLSGLGAGGPNVTIPITINPSRGMSEREIGAAAMREAGKVFRDMLAAGVQYRG